MQLSKETATRLTCYLRQAERSLDRGLQTRWSGVKSYYAERYHEELGQFMEQFPAGLSMASEKDIVGLRSRWEKRGRIRRSSRIVWGRLRSLFLRPYSFNDEELRLFLRTLRRVLELLADQQPPDPNVIVRLRMDATLSWWLIQMRYGAHLDFDRILRVECFLHPEWLESYSVDEIAAEQDQDQQRHRLCGRKRGS